MATNTELIEQYNALQAQINAKLDEYEALRRQQKALKQQMVPLYFIDGFGGSRGLAERVHFAGTHEECKNWLSYNRNMILLPDGQQIVHKDTPNVGTPPLAGAILSVTPVDERWQEISKQAELDKKKAGDDAL